MILAQNGQTNPGVVLRPAAPAANGQAVSRPAHEARALDRLRGRLAGLILLGGTVRAGELTRALDRALLDLPLDADGGTVLSRWRSQADDLSTALGTPSLPVVVLLDPWSPEPAGGGRGPVAGVRVRRDGEDVRGSGGALRDVAMEFDSDGLLLIASAAQVLLEPLSSLAADLAMAGPQVAVVAHRDGTPSGVSLVSCGLLWTLPQVGFLDFKEQGLPRLAERSPVGVVWRRASSGQTVRTRESYISALRALHAPVTEAACAAPGGAGAGVPRGGGSVAGGSGAGGIGATELIQPAGLGDDEDWRETFRLVEPGAQVDPAARIHDSVVLRGAVVPRGVVLVRCVVAEGVRLRQGQTAADQVLSAGERGRGTAAAAGPTGGGGRA